MDNNKVANSEPQLSSIPDDLIFDNILSRLPVKPLIRFKCVSKFWLSTISSSKFAKTFLEVSSSKTRSLLLKEDYDDDENSYGYFLSFDARFNIKEFVKLENKYPILNPCLSHPECTRVVDCCDGLVCLYNIQFYSCNFYLWNPATNECRDIGGPSLDHQPEDITKCFGFGYVSSIDDYRVGCVLMCDNDLSHVYIFSLRTGKWKQKAVVDVNIKLAVNQDELPAFVDNTIYWAPVSPTIELDEINGVVEQHAQDYIVGLNLLSGELKEIPLMNVFDDNEYDYYRVVRMKGCLSLCCIDYDDSDDNDNNFIKVCDVWMLKQHDDSISWEKIFSFRSEGSELLYVFEMGKCLVSKLSYERYSGVRLILHDPSQVAAQEQSEEGTVVWDGLSGGTFFQNFGGKAWGYAESLISPFLTTLAEEDGDE